MKRVIDHFRGIPVLALSVLPVLAACGAEKQGTRAPAGDGGGGMTSGSGGDGRGGGSPATGGSGGVFLPGNDGSLAGGYSEGGTTGPAMLPSDFTATDIGGFKLGDPIVGGMDLDAGAQAGPAGCGGIIRGVLRDFRPSRDADDNPLPDGHPDFQTFWGQAPTTGLVAAALGPDDKPVYASACERGIVIVQEPPTCPYGPETTTKANFDQWYRNVETVNKPYLISLFLAPNGNVFSFEDNLFFPLDGAGFGNSGTGTDEKMHNFHFTTEFHTQFKYGGGETFTFTGDDDLWVFINKKLAIDLGGLHRKATGSVNLDTDAAKLGITKGNVYALDLFHAERRTNESNFRIDTSLDFVNCGTLPPDIH